MPTPSDVVDTTPIRSCTTVPMSPCQTQTGAEWLSRIETKVPCAYERLPAASPHDKGLADPFHINRVRGLDTNRYPLGLQLHIPARV